MLPKAAPTNFATPDHLPDGRMRAARDMSPLLLKTRLLVQKNWTQPEIRTRWNLTVYLFRRKNRNKQALIVNV
jgi:hypothetical protein